MRNWNEVNQVLHINHRYISTQPTIFRHNKRTISAFSPFSTRFVNLVSCECCMPYINVGTLNHRCLSRVAVVLCIRGHC